MRNRLSRLVKTFNLTEADIAGIRKDADDVATAFYKYPGVNLTYEEALRRYTEKYSHICGEVLGICEHLSLISLR